MKNKAMYLTLRCNITKIDVFAMFISLRQWTSISLQIPSIPLYVFYHIVLASQFIMIRKMAHNSVDMIVRNAVSSCLLRKNIPIRKYHILNN